MKLFHLISSLLCVCAPALAQLPVPARQVSVDTNGWVYIVPAGSSNTAQRSLDWVDANWDPRPDGSGWSVLPTNAVCTQDVLDFIDGAWYDGVMVTTNWGFLAPTSGATQAVFDFLDDWFVSFAASTNDGLLKGTNIVGAVYSNQQWTINSQIAGLMAGTNIAAFTYNPTTLTWTANAAATPTNVLWFWAERDATIVPSDGNFLVVTGFTASAGSGIDNAAGTFTAPAAGEWEFGFGFGIGAALDQGIHEHSLYVSRYGVTPAEPDAGSDFVSSNWFGVTSVADLSYAHCHGGGTLNLSSGTVVNLLLFADDPGAYTNASFNGVYFYGHLVSE